MAGGGAGISGDRLRNRLRIILWPYVTHDYNFTSCCTDVITQIDKAIHARSYWRGRIDGSCFLIYHNPSLTGEGACNCWFPVFVGCVTPAKHGCTVRLTSRGNVFHWICNAFFAAFLAAWMCVGMFIAPLTAWVAISLGFAFGVCLFVGVPGVAFACFEWKERQRLFSLLTQRATDAQHSCSPTQTLE